MEAPPTIREIFAAAEQPVLAYCASGTRSTILWAAASANETPVAEIISAAAGAGYDLTQFEPMLNNIASS